ncbi:hypothetical protein F5Y16DRAFT_418044 [Xylariaceae sp. FL0255]|nr:hypothetical protein F5Y16DRAFT_418044 [Xylariaceae sp. FL0255]
MADNENLASGDINEPTVQKSDLENSSSKTTKGIEISVRLEGPYTPHWSGYRSAGHLLCIVGGTGVTGALSLAVWWAEHRACSDDNARFCLIWTWVELDEAWRSGSATNMRTVLHVSSESSRLDVMEILRKSLADGARVFKQEKNEGCRTEVYVSGPSGLLTLSERVCLQLQRELRVVKRSKGPLPYMTDQLGFYAAKWDL